jgi:hypothetical protein
MGYYNDLEGMKIWDYLSMRYRYYCGCKFNDPIEITSTIKKVFVQSAHLWAREEWHGECECGRKTTQFREAGI